MEISKEDLESIQKAGVSIFLNEVKSYFLLGNTNEYDNFEPKKIAVNTCSTFDKYKYACCLYAGYKIDENEDKAFELWKQCAEDGLSEAMLDYSVYLFKNDKTSEGFSWLQKSANNGNKIAQFRIALCYMFGYGVPQNEKKAFSIFQKLADEKYPNAVYMMGSFYMTDNGVFVKNDPKLGWELIKEASDLGSPFAQYEIAIQISANQGNREFTPNIIKLLQSSADGGDLRAQYLLALAYAKGEGVPLDIEMSMNYLAQSFDGGFPLAIELMERIKNSISEE